jgi:hypothetical protein
MTTRIKLRRDNTTNWEALNPVLALGEPGYDTTENKIKVGDGITAWMDLAFLTDAVGSLAIASENQLGGIKVGNNLTITEDGTLSAEDGNYTLPAATTNDLGGVKLGEGLNIADDNKVTVNKLYSTNETNSSQHYRLELDTNGVVHLPDQSIINGSTMRGIYGTGDLNYTGITIGPDSNHQEESWVWVDKDGAHVAARYSGQISTAKQWDFRNDGNIQLPAGGTIVDSDGNDLLGGGTNAGVSSITAGSGISVDQSTGDVTISVTGGVNTGDIVFEGSTITFPNNSYIKQQQEEGLIIWQTDEGGDSNDAEYVGLWYGGVPADDAPNVSITAGSYNWATDDENLEYTNYENTDADQGPRQINLDIRNSNTGNILNWHFDESGNLYLPADPGVVGTAGIVFPDGTVQTTASGFNGTGQTTPLPEWLLEVPNTQHLPIKGVDYGWDENGIWTVNATIGSNEPYNGAEGTSYPIRTNFSIPNNVTTIVTVDFIANDFGADFGIGVFADGTDPVWQWDNTNGNPQANRIGAQYNGPEPELHGISGGSGSGFGLSFPGTYRARLTVEPTGPGVATITLETLDTENTILDTISYVEESFFDTDYRIGFASDQDNGVDRTYMRNLSIEVVGVETYTSDLNLPISSINLGEFTIVNNTITVDDGMNLTTNRGSIQLGADLEFPGGPSHFHINKTSENFDLFFGDDSNYVMLPAQRNGVVIGANPNPATNYSTLQNWAFRTNGGLQFPDGTTQYGAAIEQELMLDGGSAISQFPINMTNPRLADGGGSASRFGNYDPNYDGSNNGAYISPVEFTLTLNGGGA